MGRQPILRSAGWYSCLKDPVAFPVRLDPSKDITLWQADLWKTGFLCRFSGINNHLGYAISPGTPLVRRQGRIEVHTHHLLDNINVPFRVHPHRKGPEKLVSIPRINIGVYENDVFYQPPRPD